MLGTLFLTELRSWTTEFEEKWSQWILKRSEAFLDSDFQAETESVLDVDSKTEPVLHVDLKTEPVLAVDSKTEPALALNLDNATDMNSAFVAVVDSYS